MSSPLAGRPFYKMNGAGNEIVVLDLRGTDLAVRPHEARAIGRGQGLKFDQLMVLHDPRSPGTQAFVKIYNIDGSEAEACGNGTRCVTWAMTRGSDTSALKVETVAGILDCTRQGEWLFTIDMGRPRFDWQHIPLSRPADPQAVDLTSGPIGGKILANPSVANMGNPHAIFWVEDVEAYDLTAFGPKLEHDPIFPQKANISLAHVVSRDHIVVKVWERGVGLTLACGSAACAVAVSAARSGVTGRKVRVSLPGGDLFIEWRDDDHVMMTGPVELEFEGAFTPALFADEMV